MPLEYKELPIEIKAEDVDDTGFFKGYASTFGGKPDSYGDIIVEGAFSKTLEKGGAHGFGAAMLWQHQTDKPVGVWTKMAENKKGLPVEGQLAIKTQLGHDAHELMKMKAIKALSIGFTIPKEGSEYDKDRDIRYIKEIDLWEISLVTFPANTHAKITGVKSILDAKNERELETALREAGLSRREAMKMVSLCKPTLLRKKQDSLVGVLDSLREVNKQLDCNNK